MIHLERVNGQIRATIPYDVDFLENLRATIPSWAREWRKEGRYWLVDARFEVDLTDLLNAHFGYVQPVRQDSSPYAALHLLPDAPPELVTAAYRTLAKIHHPDRGGDVARMQSLNLAWERLSRGISV